MFINRFFKQIMFKNITKKHQNTGDQPLKKTTELFYKNPNKLPFKRNYGRRNIFLCTKILEC